MRQRLCVCTLGQEEARERNLIEGFLLVQKVLSYLGARELCEEEARERGIDQH